MSESSLVSLRPLGVPDAVVLGAWSQDERFRVAAEWSADLTLSQHVAFQRELIAGPPEGLVRLGVVYEGDLVGYVVFQGTEPDRRELGFVIGGSRRWGRGLGRRAAEAGLAYGFGELSLAEIWAEAWAANTASVRVLESLGMRELDRGEAGVYRGIPTFYRRFALARPS